MIGEQAAVGPPPTAEESFKLPLPTFGRGRLYDVTLSGPLMHGRHTVGL